MSTALVLGGGGIAGVAWEIGLLCGLRRAGVDLTDAGVIVGTSAGSIVGALVATGVDLEVAADTQRGEWRDEPPFEIDFAVLAEVFGTLADTSLPPVERRARVGALALAAPTGDEQARVAAFGRRLPYHDWPDRLIVTAVDVETGEEVFWRSDAGVPLVAAVTASCAVPAIFPPVTIGGRRYMDGGIRSGTNADAATGASTVLVVAPMARMSPLGAPPHEIDALRAGAQVLLVAPDDDAMEAFGPNVLDPARREPSLAAGLAQGAAVADDVRSLWAGNGR